jgi:DNA polymerase III delta prime subunit
MPDDLDPAQFGSAFMAFMQAMTTAADQPRSPLMDRIQTHLGTDPTQLPVISEEYDAFEHPNAQVALDAYLAGPERQADLVGVGGNSMRNMNFSLSDFLSQSGFMGRMLRLTEGPVDYVNFHLAGGRVLSCVQFGLYFVRNGETPLVVFIAGPSDQHGPRQKLRVEVVARRSEECQAFLAELTDLMARRNVYRGHVISLSPGQFGPGPQSLIAFHTLPDIAREDVILPEGVLERVERQTIVFAEQAERLLAAGRSLKRGLLLYGPPGVGKTLTVMHLIGRMPGRTVILTTGLGLGLLQPIVQLARSLAPSMVVIEDIDLIAQERGQPFGHAGPLLFELLNEMDGLRDDSDIIFALTTNRPDILEPALAARPGRIDLAVELPLPDAQGRRLLLQLYARGLQLQDVDLDAIVARTEGATPAYFKELLRKAAVLAAAESADGAEHRDLVVTAAHLETALAELDEGGRLAQRLLGLHPGEPTPGGAAEQSPHMRPIPPTGFPMGHTVHTTTRIVSP